MYDDISDALIEQETDLYDRFCRVHARCKGRRRNECCSADQIEMHRACCTDWTISGSGGLVTVLRFREGRRARRDGYGKKAQKLYMDMLKREAIRKAAKASDPSTTVAEIVKNEIRAAAEVCVPIKDGRREGSERMEEKAEYERLKVVPAEKSESLLNVFFIETHACFRLALPRVSDGGVGGAKQHRRRLTTHCTGNNVGVRHTC